MEKVIVLLIVLGAVVLLVKHFMKSAKSGSSGCSGCGGNCPAPDSCEDTTFQDRMGK